MNNFAYWILPICPRSRSVPEPPSFCTGWIVAADWRSDWELPTFLEMKDSSFKTERDVEFALHLPVLAMVPAIEPLLAKNGKNERGT